MRVGVLLMPTDPWPETEARAQQLEAMGFDHLWVYDHINWQRYRERPWFTAIPWLTGIAGATTRIRLGTLVANPNIRHPLTFAKDAITLDHISGGRLALGIGAGGTGLDATILGQDELSPGQRRGRLGEFLELIDGLLTARIGRYEGNYYSVNDAYIEPRCVQQPRVPLAVAAGAPGTISLAARFGDAWITWGDSSRHDLTPEGTEQAVRSQMHQLELACETAQRSVDDLDRVFLVGNSEDRPLRSVDAFVHFAGTYREIGFTDLVFHHPRPDDPIWDEDPAVVDLIAEALPELHAL